jgi:trehalose/maltose hydrolase-like predicted phosphorylase
MFVPFHDDGIISQFEGYEELEELDWDAYRGRYGNIQRLDRILRAEGDDPNRYKVSKQADVIMLFYLFEPAVIRELIERLGYEYRPDTAARNISYYDRRTSHGSTLSFVTFAGVLAQLDPESSWERFLVALRSDVEDIQGGTTREGIHMGVMSGTVDLMQRVYPGAEMRDGVIRFQPRLPAAVEQVAFRMQFQRTPMHVTLDHERLTISIHREGAGGPLQVGVGDELRELCPGDTETFELSSPVAAGKKGSNA